MTKKKFDVVQKYPNLANVEGSFTQVIEENMNTLSLAMEDETVSDENFKEIIFHIMKQCKQSPYISKVRSKIEQMRTKREICFYVIRAALKGENLGTVA